MKARYTAAVQATPGGPQTIPEIRTDWLSPERLPEWLATSLARRFRRPVEVALDLDVETMRYTGTGVALDDRGRLLARIAVRSTKPGAIAA